MSPDGSNYVELQVTAGEAELAADALWAAGAIAIEEAVGPDGTVTLRAGVPAGDLEAVVATVGAQWPARAVAVDAASWADTWRRFAAPVRAGSRLVVWPAWLARDDRIGPHDVVLELDPGRAFGSGSHPSTRQALAELEARIRPGDAVLDVGCGSGVLAVAAALLGAGSIVAVDIDPEAVRATGENAARNGVGDVVDVREGDVSTAAADGPFDIVVVNIGAAAIIEAAPLLAGLLAPRGLLVLAGFLVAAADRVVAAFSAFDDFDVEGRQADGEWSALVLRRAQ